MAAASSAASNSPISAFTNFLQDWIIKQQSLLQELESLLSKQEFTDHDIIPRVLSHYQQLYSEKAKIANLDIFVLISPPWLTSFERSLLWISDFRPSSLFPLLETQSFADDLSNEQKSSISSAKAETKRKEREIMQAMARVQESVAEPPLYSLIKKYGRLVDGEVSEFDEVIEKLKEAMMAVVAEADTLRSSTAVDLLGLLNPVQGVKFLAAAMRFQLGARKFGLEKDLQRGVERNF